MGSIDENHGNLLTHENLQEIRDYKRMAGHLFNENNLKRKRIKVLYSSTIPSDIHWPPINDGIRRLGPEPYTILRGKSNITNPDIPGSSEDPNDSQFDFDSTIEKQQLVTEIYSTMQQIKRITNLKNKQDIDEQDPQLAARLNLQMLYTVLDNLKLKQTVFDVPPKKGMEQKDDDDDDDDDDEKEDEDEDEDETEEDETDETEEDEDDEKEKEKEEEVVIKQEDDQVVIKQEEETVEIKQEDDIYVRQEECMAIKKEEEYVSIKQEDDDMAVNEVKMHMDPNQEREYTPMKQERTILGWESILSSAIESKVPKDVIERVYRQLSKLYKITLPSIERHLYTPLNTLPKPVIPLSVYESSARKRLKRWSRAQDKSIRPGSVRDLWVDDEAQMKMVNDIERKFAFLQERIRNDTKGGWDK